MKLKEIIGKNTQALLDIQYQLLDVSDKCKVTFFNRLNERLACSMGELFEMVVSDLDNHEAKRMGRYNIEFSYDDMNKIFNPIGDGEDTLLTSFSATIAACFLIIDNSETVMKKGATKEQIVDIYTILFHALMNAPNNSFYDNVYVDYDSSSLNKSQNSVMVLISDIFGTMFFNSNTDKIEEWYLKWKEALDDRFEIEAFKYYYSTEIRPMINDKNRSIKWI